MEYGTVYWTLHLVVYSHNKQRCSDFYLKGEVVMVYAFIAVGIFECVSMLVSVLRDE